MSEAETIEEILNKLHPRGDYPTPKALAESVKVLVNDPLATFRKPAHLILNDPILALRAISVTNSTVYLRSAPKIILSQALSNVGLKKIPEIVGSTSRVDSYSNFFGNRGIGEYALYRVIYSSFLAAELSRFFISDPLREEFARILSSLTNVGYLATAVYAPEMISASHMAKYETQISFSEAFKNYLGVSPQDFSKEFSRYCNVPGELVAAVPVAFSMPWNRSKTMHQGEKISPFVDGVAAAVAISNRLTGIIFEHSSSDSITEFLEHVSRRCSVDIENLQISIVKATRRLIEGFLSLGLEPFYLCDYLHMGLITDTDINNETINAQDIWPRVPTKVGSFVNQIKPIVRGTFEGNEEYLNHLLMYNTVCCLYSVFGAERVAYYEFEDVLKLYPKYYFGENLEYNLDSYSVFLQKVEGEYHPVAKVCKRKEPVFNGESILTNEAGILAFPVMSAGNMRGVIYAERNLRRFPTVSPDEQISLTLLAEMMREL
ncbi:MAG: HDOD domain-containing protein [Deltaproteobacteria bacterium]|nr:HDOD domain-containing protein [Deltaproteobacteria bacterium]